MCHSGIIPIDGSLKFKCPSRDGLSNHIVSITVEHDTLLFTCDCPGGFDMKATQYCVHINTVLISTYRQYIGNSCEYIDKKEKYTKHKKNIDNLEQCFNKLFI